MNPDLACAVALTATLIAIGVVIWARGKVRKARDDMKFWRGSARDQLQFYINLIDEVNPLRAELAAVKTEYEVFQNSVAAQAASRKRQLSEWGRKGAQVTNSKRKV